MARQRVLTEKIAVFLLTLDSSLLEDPPLQDNHLKHDLFEVHLSIAM